MTKLIRPVRATEPLDPSEDDLAFNTTVVKVIEALHDIDDIVDLALAVADKRVDPTTAVTCCRRVADYRAALIGEDMPQ